MNLSVDVKGLDKLNGLPDEIQGAVLRAVQNRGGQIVLNAKAQEMNQTYGRPVRRLKNGKPAYPRTGEMQRSQRAEPTSDGVRIYGEGEGGKHEEWIEELPTGPDGINRSNAIARKAADKVTGTNQLGRAIENEAQNELSKYR